MIGQVLERAQLRLPQGWEGFAARLSGRLVQLTDALRRMHQRRRQRLALSRLDPRLLDDIGVSAEAARREVAKPPWRA